MLIYKVKLTLATSMKNNPSGRVIKLWLITAFILGGLLLVGCRNTQPPIIEGPQVVEPPTPVAPGAEVSVKVDVISDRPVSYQWTTDQEGGQIIRGDTSSAAVWQAPQRPGTYNIYVGVKVDEVVIDKSVAIKVEPASTPTPTSTSTATPLLNETPLPTNIPPSTDLASPPITSQAVINAIYTNQPPKIEGDLNEAVWSQSQPLTFAIHPANNDSTTASVRLLWDNKYLYAGFEVNDTHIESSSTLDPFNSDSISLIMDNGGQIREYRYSLAAPDRIDRKGDAISAHYFKETTSFDDPNKPDNGYSVEMQIPWAIPPVAGSRIAADFLSVDHDQNPGEAYDAARTFFSKISWDGDQNVETATKNILLVTLPPATPTLTHTLLSTAPVHVLNVKDGQTIAQSVSLVGKYAPEISDDIWVLAGLLGDRLYPQSPQACAGEAALKLSGYWEVPINLGDADDVNAYFEIVVTTANHEASQFLAQTIQTWCQKKEFPGLPRAELPAGLIEHQHITVMRRNVPSEPHPPVSNIELTGQLSITNLNNDDPAPQSFKLNGTAGSEVTDPIWVLIYAPNGRFYPQSSNACANLHTLREGNLWQVPLSLGGPDDVGKPFDIIVVLADASANAFFEEKQQAWCQANDYRGFLSIELPAGIAEKASIRVIRQ